MPNGYDQGQIIALRSQKNVLDPYIPYHFLHEFEPGLNGKPERVNTVFLTSKECSFRCVMCDLWKNTLDKPLPRGAIVKQIDHALSNLPEADTIKLYNNGNFFDTKAIYREDYPGIISRLKNYHRVVVENHPRLCDRSCVEFSQQLGCRLEIAMGLETIHPEALPALNKQLTKKDFQSAASFLNQNNIDVRAFVLLNAPFITDPDESIEWTLRTTAFALESGAARCSIIATRPGNGIMDQLQKEKKYAAPTLAMLEEVFDKALSMKQGQVFVDTWNIHFLSACDLCFDARVQRLEKMNLEQKIHPRIFCSCNNRHD